MAEQVNTQANACDDEQKKRSDRIRREEEEEVQASSVVPHTEASWRGRARALPRFCTITKSREQYPLIAEHIQYLRD